MHSDTEFLALFWITAILIVAIIIGAVWASREAGLARTYRLVALAWKGTYNGWSPLLPGRLLLTHARSVLTVSTYFVNGRRMTEVAIGWPDQQMWLEVRPRTFADIVQNLFGTRLRTGNKLFDATHMINGSPDDRVRTLLSGGAQSAIEKLSANRRPRRVYVTIAHGQLRVTTSGIYREYQAIDLLLRDFCQLYDQLTLIESLEIEFFASEFGTDEVAICQVCGDEIHDSPVACRSCDTLHHLDCWRYIGACSIYACGERRYRHEMLPRGGESRTERGQRSTT